MLIQTCLHLCFQTLVPIKITIIDHIKWKSTNPGQVTNSEILKSIQSITEVMQQQFLLNSKTTEQGIVQMASLFQEMIKAQEKRDLDPALLAIPTFLGEAKDRPQCLDWVSRVKNVCDQSGHSFLSGTH